MVGNEEFELPNQLETKAAARPLACGAQHQQIYYSTGTTGQVIGAEN